METRLKCKNLRSVSQSAFNSKIWSMPAVKYSGLFALRSWIIFLAVFSFCKSASVALAQDDATAKTQDNSAAKTQDDSAAKTSLEKQLLELRLGPFDLHPRLVSGVTYDDNILYSIGNKEADTIWMVQPALQAVAGDDAALIAYRDQHSDVLTLSPGNFIFQQPADWPGKVLILDYGPRFQLFDKYTVNNSLDQFATLDLLWPMDKLILGFRQEYQLQKETIIEAGERTTVELIPTTLSAAYQLSDKTSIEGNLRRFSIDYEAPGLIGYTEYNTEDWFNYNLEEDLPVSLGVLAGIDDVANHQGQTYEQLRARARYIYTEKLNFDVSVGGELRQYENGSPETLNPVFTAVGEYRLSELTRLLLTGYRQQYAAIFNGYNYAASGASLEVRQGITDRFTVSLSGGYYGLQYSSASVPVITHTDGYSTARLSLQAKIVRHLNGQIFCQWVSRQSQFNGDLSDDQAGVQVSLSY